MIRSSHKRRPAGRMVLIFLAAPVSMYLCGMLTAVLTTVLVAACYRAHELAPDESVDASRDASEHASDHATSLLVWALVHPSDALRGPDLYLFDEARQEIIRQLPLPEGVTSPHALAWDGRSLWLGGIDVDPAVRELDPLDGRVRSRWAGVVTEGIATDGDTCWYTGVAAAFSPLVQVARDGTTLSSSTLPESSVQDLVSAAGALYYLVNDGVDRIVRIDPAPGGLTDVVRGVHEAPYQLDFDGTHLAVAVDGRIRRYDPTTGALVRESAFAVPGWITAIAFVR